MNYDCQNHTKKTHAHAYKKRETPLFQAFTLNWWIENVICGNFIHNSPIRRKKRKCVLLRAKGNFMIAE
jgi:hypothetical protein